MSGFRVNYILTCSFFSKAGNLIPSGVALPTSIQVQNKLLYRTQTWHYTKYKIKIIFSLPLVLVWRHRFDLWISLYSVKLCRFLSLSLAILKSSPLFWTLLKTHRQPSKSPDKLVGAVFSNTAYTAYKIQIY